MRPVPSPLNTVAVPIRHDEQRGPDQPVPPAIHRLAEVKLESPYKNAIPGFLEKQKIRITGEAIFDDCIFQSVLFTHFFEKLETGELKPGQPEHDQPAQYLLNKSVELLQPLSDKIKATCRQYDEMLPNSPPELHAKLEKELKFVQGMAARFETLERDLLDALGHPENFSPTRDKACFLLFAHAMLSDAADELQRWMNDLPTAELTLPTLPGDEKLMVLSYVTKDEPRSNLFSSAPLSPADAQLYNKGLSARGALDGMEKLTVPSFTQTGSQGVLAILHCIFHGKALLSGAAGTAHAVHGKYYHEDKLPTLRHDCDHLQIMMQTRVLSSVAPKLMSIYRKLENPGSGLPAEDVKKDLVVLFHMLHESIEIMMTLMMPAPRKSFLDCARGFFNREFVVIDMVTLLNKVGFSIAPVDVQSAPEEKAACYEAVALAMDSLWKEFRGRHGEDLAASGLFAKLPRFLAD